MRLILQVAIILSLFNVQWCQEVECSLELMNSDLYQIVVKYLQPERSESNQAYKEYYSQKKSKVEYMNGLNTYFHLYLLCIVLALFVFLVLWFSFYRKRNDKNRQVKHLRRRDFLKQELIVRICCYLLILMAIFFVFIIVYFPKQFNLIDCLSKEVEQFLQHGNMATSTSSASNSNVHNWQGLQTLINNIQTFSQTQSSSIPSAFALFSQMNPQDYLQQIDTFKTNTIQSYVNSHNQDAYSSPSMVDYGRTTKVPSYFSNYIVGDTTIATSALGQLSSQLDITSAALNRLLVAQQALSTHQALLSTSTPALTAQTKRLQQLSSHSLSLSAQSQQLFQPNQQNQLQLVLILLLFLLLVVALVPLSVSSKIFKKNTSRYRKALLFSFFLSWVGCIIIFAVLSTQFPSMIWGIEYCYLDKQLLDDPVAFDKYFPDNQPEVKEQLKVCLHGQSSLFDYYQLKDYQQVEELKSRVEQLKQYQLNEHQKNSKVNREYIQQLQSSLPLYRSPNLYSDAMPTYTLTDYNPHYTLNQLSLWVDATLNYYITCRFPQDQFVFSDNNCTYTKYVSNSATPLGLPTCLNVLTVDSSILQSRYESAFAGCQYQYSYVKDLVVNLQKYTTSRDSYFRQVEVDLGVLVGQVTSLLSSLDIPLQTQHNLITQPSLVQLFNLNPTMLPTSTDCRALRNKYYRFHQQVCQSFVPLYYLLGLLFTASALSIFLLLVPLFRLWHFFYELDEQKQISQRINESKKGKGGQVSKPNGTGGHMSKSNGTESCNVSNSGNSHLSGISCVSQFKGLANLDDVHINIEEQVIKEQKNIKMDIRSKHKDKARWAGQSKINSAAARRKNHLDVSSLQLNPNDSSQMNINNSSNIYKLDDSKFLDNNSK